MMARPWSWSQRCPAENAPVVGRATITCARRGGEVTGCRTGRRHGDELRVPGRCLVYLPSNVDVRDACLVEPLAVVIHGMRRAGLEGGQRVAVVGEGPSAFLLWR